MFAILFRKGSKPRQVAAIGIVFLSLAFTFYNQSLYVLAQEAGAQSAQGDQPAAATVPVSDEVKTSVESQLQVSAEAAKEAAVDIKAELGLPANYDPVVPDSFIHTIGYDLKNLGRNIQEKAYDTFASEGSYAQVVKDHANKEFIEATKLYAEDSKAAGKVLGILNEYKNDLVNVEKAIPEIKKEDPTLAKELSADVAGDHMFVTPKVLGAMQEAILTTAPERVPELVAIKNQVLESAGQAVVSASDNQQEVVRALQTIATENQSTPFSGILTSEVLSQTKSQLGNNISDEIKNAFDEVIGSQLKSLGENIKNLPASDEVKADSFAKYVAQLPGQNLERMKVLDEFKSSDLSPLWIEKMQEVKAKVAETIGAKIQNLVQEEIRKAVSQAMLDVKNPGVADFKVFNEFRDLVPGEEFKKEIAAHHEEQVQKFLDRFGNDANAQQVTAEFDALTKKVQNGQIVPDANFFKTLEALKNRLNPEQQKFIESMENSGKQQMLDRLQNDRNFAQQFATFNPADVEIYKKIGQEGFGPQFGPPASFNFDAKFKAIEQQQAQNFGRFIEFQNRPEDVQAIRQQFENVIPPEVRQRFEQQYNFGAESFTKQEEFARQKADFFRQKFEEAQKEFETKYGQQGPQGPFPGQIPSPFPGGPGFPFPGAPSFGAPGFPALFSGQPGQQGGNGVTPSYVGQPIDASTGCPVGMVKGQYGCEFKFERAEITRTCPEGYSPTAFGCEPNYRSVDQVIRTPEEYCRVRGGNWDGNQCVMPAQGNGTCPPGYRSVPTPQTGFQCVPEFNNPSSTGSCAAGSHWMSDNGGWCMQDGGTATSYPTPNTTYPTPTGDPTTDCAKAGGTWTSGYCKMPNNPTPYPTPTGTAGPENCATVGGTWRDTYCQMSNTTYPTPATTGTCATGYHWMAGTATASGYCMADGETTTYPTPSTTYPTPSTGTCATGYHWMAGTATSSGYCMADGGTTTYPTPSTTYPTPSTSYPTPSTSTTYPTPSTSYPTPATTYPTPSTSYPTPSTSYPTPSTSYPTPATSYPTPAYPTPSYPTPSYPTPAYPTPSYPTPSYPTPPTSFGPHMPSVAGMWTRTPNHDLGVFDFLSLFGLGVYGFMKKRKERVTKTR